MHWNDSTSFVVNTPQNAETELAQQIKNLLLPQVADYLSTIHRLTYADESKPT